MIRVQKRIKLKLRKKNVILVLEHTAAALAQFLTNEIASIYDVFRTLSTPVSMSYSTLISFSDYRLSPSTSHLISASWRADIWLTILECTLTADAHVRNSLPFDRMFIDPKGLFIYFILLLLNFYFPYCRQRMLALKI